MKARSVVFTHLQWPFTVFGLPPKMMVISMTAGTLVFVLTIVLGVIALSMFGFFLTTAGGLVLSYRLARHDHHVESVFLASARFWRASSRRWLLAGASPLRSSLREEGRS